MPASVIGPDIRICGAVEASEDLVVAGTVEGTLTVVGTLTIERGAKIHGEVTARDIVLHGELTQPARATATFRLGPTAVMASDIEAARLIVEEGAILDGRVKTGTSPKRAMELERMRPASPRVAAPAPAPIAVAGPAPVAAAAPLPRPMQPKAAAPQAPPSAPSRDRAIPELPTIGRRRLERR